MLNEIEEKSETIADNVVKELECRNDRVFARNLDDFVPFLSYLNQDDFLLRKTEKILKDGDIIYRGFFQSKHGFIYSWANDEWLGGLLRLQEQTSSPLIQQAIDDFSSNLPEMLLTGGLPASFSLPQMGGVYKTPVFNPRSGALLEVLLETDLLRSEVGSPHMLQSAYQTPCFKTNQVFPDSCYLGAFSILNLCAKHSPLTSSSFRSVREIFPTRRNYTSVKHNSSMLHAAITGYRQRPSIRLQDRIDTHINGIIDIFVKNGAVRKTPNGPPLLAVNHPIIDSLCDAYYFVHQSEEYLQKAKQIADKWINNRLQTGLFPRKLDSNESWLDDQIDIAISLGRIAELSGEERYEKISRNTLDAVFSRHYTGQGLVECVNGAGDITDPEIHPKYNALSLKGYGYLAQKAAGRNIYSDDTTFHSFLKDR